MYVASTTLSDRQPTSDLRLPSIQPSKNPRILSQNPHPSTQKGHTSIGARSHQQFDISLRGINNPIKQKL